MVASTTERHGESMNAIETDLKETIEQIKRYELDHAEMRQRYDVLTRDIKNFEKGTELALVRRSIAEPCKELSSEKKIALVASEKLREDAGYQNMRAELAELTIAIRSNEIEIEYLDNMKELYMKMVR